MVRRSVPASSRWEAKLWRRVCTLTGLSLACRRRRQLTDLLDRPRTDRLVGLASGEEMEKMEEIAMDLVVAELLWGLLEDSVPATPPHGRCKP